MGIMSIFSNKSAQDAANAQKAGLQAGYDSAKNELNAGLGYATNYYNDALGTYAPLAGTATAGMNAYADALGLNGQAGYNRATQNFQAGPGYQWQLGQGLAAIDRGAAARGTLSSGGTQRAEQAYGQNLANQTWNQYLSNLSGYNPLAYNYANAQSGVYGNLGNLNYNNGQNLANLGWNMNTGMGNAQANAELADYNSSGNFWNLLQNGAKLAVQGYGYSKFAKGGRPAVGQPAIVGEEGPELFVPDRPGTIVPNDKMRKMGDLSGRRAKMKAAAKANGKRLGDLFSKAH